jgi:hypothetical protein
MSSPGRRRTRPSDLTSDFPTWVAPQLTELVGKVPAGDEWAHEIELDGYRMHARIDHGQVQLLTRTGLDWTAKYQTTATPLQGLAVEQANIDGERQGSLLVVYRPHPLLISRVAVARPGRGCFGIPAFVLPVTPNTYRTGVPNCRNHCSGCGVALRTLLHSLPRERGTAANGWIGIAVGQPVVAQVDLPFDGLVAKLRCRATDDLEP